MRTINRKSMALDYSGEKFIFSDKAGNKIHIFARDLKDAKRVLEMFCRKPDNYIEESEQL